jgi:hypothetical protein
MTVKRIGASAVWIVAVLVAAPTLRAYLTFGFELNGKNIAVRWNSMPVRYFITNRDVPGATASQLQAAAQQGFAAWAKTPAVTLSAQFVGFTSAEPSVDDGISVIGFQFRPELSRTLGATQFAFDDVSGALIESDIFLNSAVDWSAAPAGASGRYDVQSIVTHELGHLHGLGHSALGETELQSTGGRRVVAKRAIMFPIAFPAGNTDDRTPKPDDAAGLGEIYQSPTFNRDYGQINGRVTLNGQGVFGAHVTAFNSATGALVGGFCLDSQGRFTIGGLPAGVYVVRAEPLDDADLDSFFDADVPVNINFKPTYSSHLVAVQAGGGSPAIEIKVTAK